MKTTARGRAVERFRGNRLFEGVDADIIERIAPKLGVLRKKPGEIIFREGEPGNSLYLVGKGCVKIAKAADSVDCEIFDYVDQGNLFGATVLLAGEPHSTTATAVEPALIGALTKDTFQEILELSPSRLHMNFLRAITARVRTFERYGDLQTNGVGLAVAKAIVEAHGGKISVRSVVDKGTTVDIRLPKPNGE
jgi:CRP/FNR family cyclic AMP-dependent transcriptional regulator